MSPSGRSKQTTTQQLAPYLGLGLQLAASMTAFGALGYWLDGLWKTTPWLLVVGSILGATGGMIAVIRSAIRSGRTRSSESSASPARAPGTDAGRDGATDA